MQPPEEMWRLLKKPNPQVSRQAVLSVTPFANLNSFEGALGTISYEGTNEATKDVIINYITNGEIQETYTI